MRGVNWIVMIKSISIIILVFLSGALFAQSIEETWKELDQQYSSLYEHQEYSSALEIAFKLNDIDPANTKTLYRIVDSSIKAGIELPSWVLSKPWPDATEQDRNFRMQAESLVNAN